MLSTELALRLQKKSGHAADTSALDLLLGTLSSPPSASPLSEDQVVAGGLGGSGLAGNSNFGAFALGTSMEHREVHPSSTATPTAKPPALVDNLADVQAGYEQAVLAWRTRQESRVHTFALAIAIGSATLLLACAIVLILRLAAQAWTWPPALGGALALIVASVWLGQKIDDPIHVEVQPIAHYHGTPATTANTAAFPKVAAIEAQDRPVAPLPIQRFRYDTLKEPKEPPTSAPTTLLWDPLLSTNDHGEAQLHFALPQPAPRYRIRIDAHGNGRLGSLEHLVDAPPPLLPAPAQN